MPSAVPNSSEWQEVPMDTYLCWEDGSAPVPAIVTCNGVLRNRVLSGTAGPDEEIYRILLDDKGEYETYPDGSLVKVKERGNIRIFLPKPSNQPCIPREI